MIIKLIARGAALGRGQVGCTSCALGCCRLWQSCSSSSPPPCPQTPALATKSHTSGNEGPKFLNAVQVILHISKNRQLCGLSPPLFSFWTGDVSIPVPTKMMLKGCRASVSRRRRRCIFTAGEPALSRGLDWDRL